MEKAYEWLLKEFSIDGAAARIIRNVLEYADRMGGDEQYDFLTEMLDGTIGDPKLVLELKEAWK